VCRQTSTMPHSSRPLTLTQMLPSARLWTAQEWHGQLVISPPDRGGDIDGFIGSRLVDRLVIAERTGSRALGAPAGTK